MSMCLKQRGQADLRINTGGSFIDPLALAHAISVTLHCKNCGVLCPPNEQHTTGVISHRPLKVCIAHLIWCARSRHTITHHIWCVKVWYAIGVLSHLTVECVLNTVFGVLR